jgi:predicted small lipoprotein YifL
VNRRLLTGVALVVAAASGCGLKGPLYLPEKSDVTIRPAPAATTPEAPAEPAPTTEPQPAPEPAPKPEQPPQDPQPGTGRG